MVEGWLGRMWLLTVGNNSNRRWEPWRNETSVFQLCNIQQGRMASLHESHESHAFG